MTHIAGVLPAARYADLTHHTPSWNRRRVTQGEAATKQKITFIIINLAFLTSCAAQTYKGVLLWPD